MKLFVGFGYNDRDSWIEKQVFPILNGMGFTVVHGKGMHGDILQSEVKTRIDQSDAAIGFFTIREGQGDADFTSHLWVRDEMVHANAKKKPIIPVKEEGVKVPDGLLGDRQYILLRQNERLACVAELVVAIGRRNIRRLKLDPNSDQLKKNLWQLRKIAGFVIRYRTKDEMDIESQYRDGRMELVDQGFYLNVSDVPKRGFVEVEGVLNGEIQFSSGWASADAVQVVIS
jgi:hypothetical protein